MIFLLETMPHPQYNYSGQAAFKATPNTANNHIKGWSHETQERFFLASLAGAIATLAASPGAMAEQGQAAALAIGGVDGSAARAAMSDPSDANLWIYDSTEQTLSLDRDGAATIVVSNVTANGTALTIGDNRANPLAVELDFTPGIEGDWTLTTTANNSFEGNSSLSSDVVFPATLRTINQYSFRNTSITSITAAGVTRIGKGAFQNCKSLTDISGILAEGLVTIEADAFREANLIRGDLVFPDSLKTIGDMAFASTFRGSGEEAKGTVQFGSQLASFGKGVFAYCYGLVGTLLVHDSVGYIWQEAFRECRGLEALVIEGGCDSIGSMSFQNCIALKLVVLSPDTVSIHARSFEGCSSLERFYMTTPPTTYDNTMNDKFSNYQVTYYVDYDNAAAWRAFADDNASFTLPEGSQPGTWAGASRTQYVRWGSYGKKPTIILLR